MLPQNLRISSVFCGILPFAGHSFVTILGLCDRQLNNLSAASIWLFNISMELMEPSTVNVNNAKSSKLSIPQKILLAATGGIGIGLTVISFSFVAPAFRRICLPYVPATTEQIANVLNLLPKPAPGKLLDIGSGDGRIVIAAAQHGIQSDGVELNPWLVWFSRLSALRNGVHKQTSFFRRDLWKFNLQPYNYIVIFGVEQMMKDLEHKLIKEASINTKVLACRFPLPKLQPQKIIEDGVNSVWYYDLSASKSPNNDFTEGISS